MAAVPPPIRTQDLSAVVSGSHVPPETLAIDKQRVSLLLDINQLLLLEVVKLQEDGKGGDLQPPRSEDGGAPAPRGPVSGDFAEYVFTFLKWKPHGTNMRNIGICGACKRI